MARFRKREKQTTVQRWVLYARYSPRPSDSDSIERQVATMEEWVAKYGGEIDSIHFDAETSGYVPIFRRPGLVAALSQLQQGWGFLVRDMDRAARDLSVSLSIETEIFAVGARLAVVSAGGIQPRITDDENGWAMRQISAIFAQLARIRISKQTSATMKRRQSRGDKMGGTAPLGKVIAEKQLVDSPTENGVVERITELHAMGLGPHAISTQLTKDGYQPRGKRWHPKSIHRILSRLELAAASQ